MRLFAHAVTAVLAVVWRAFVVATPVLGAWLASSLTAWFGGPKELALTVAVLLFPIVPLAWEARGARRFKQKEQRAKEKEKDPPQRFLKTGDRIILRTLVVNGLFIGALLAVWPKEAFTALATRGDWFVDGQTSPLADHVRVVTTTAARGLEWLHKWANPNPNKHEGDDVVPDDVVPVDEKKEPVKDPVKDPTQDPKQDPTPPKPLAGDVEWKVGKTTWPRPEVPHRLLSTMTAADQASIASVGAFFAKNEPDLFERTKGLHDWLVQNLHYDHDSLPPGVRKGQDAETVFRLRMGVCEGYARLFVAFGAAAGVKVVYVTGDVREENGEPADVGHAWNGVQIDGLWYFVDVTWDDPTMAGGGDSYRTDYLFLPPSLAILNHFPDDSRWQLLEKPLPRAAFLRQPRASPAIAKYGLTLKRPERPRIDASGSVDVVIDNPWGRWLMVEIGPKGGKGTRCRTTNPGATADDQGFNNATVRTASCPVVPGRQELRLFHSKQQFGSYDGVASITVDGK